MGYTVRYGTAAPKRFERTKVRIRIPAALLLLLLSVAGIQSVWPQEMKLLRSTLLPWTQEPVKVAIAGLVEDLSAGESFPNAVTAFCQELLHESAVSN